MTYSGEDYDVIVIGKGHAGKEAAKKAARMGKTALLLKLNPGSIASVMCSSSQQGSPGGIPSGIEAQLVRLEDESNWSPRLKFEKLDSGSHHSVYILQVPEMDPEKQLLYGSDEEESAPPEIEAVDISAETGSPGQSVEPFAETKEIPDNAPASDPSPYRWERKSSHPEPEPEEDTVLHQREIYNRKRLLHRQSPPVDRELPTAGPPSGQGEKSREPVFRERDKDLRKKLVQDRRSPVDQTHPGLRDLPSSPPIHGKQTGESPATEAHPLPDAKESHPGPFTHVQQPGQRPAKRTSSSVIPMEQGRIKYRKAGRQKEPFRLIGKEKQTPPTSPSPEPSSPDSSLVWEERNPQREQTLTYEPFQEMKEKGPLSRPSMNPTREKAGTRREGGPPSSPATPGPLQGQSRKSPPTVKREDQGMMPQPQRTAPTPPPRREDPKTGSHFHLNQEAARNVLKNSNDGLKKDELDISDPFGQSYDEFLTPFSGGNPQDEQLEKRKLALRGLHNLINNLG
ncbi:FAD-dependent oxidoreductase [Kroppenstedtia eburnea]|uniref:FAD-dependent oxidoreductase n=1 Tax=Kroppenstedtia eburnea TaxID=714067 RepID=UPI00364246CD